MGTHFKQGFTIIETMLVLAITGVLVATLLVGLGGSINAQRYKDSVTSFRATLQDQYSMVDNVSNDRDASWMCSSSATTAPDSMAGTTPGQSDCVLLGRYVSVVNDTISTASIVGYQNSNSASANDITDIKANYSLGISTASIQTSTLEWGAQIAWPASGLDIAPSSVSPAPPSRAIGILIIRSPQSGTAYTFTSNVVYAIDTITSANLLAMMVVNTGTVPGQMQRFLCIDPSPGSTGLTVPEKLAVSINQASSDASGIEARSDTTTASLGGTTKCQ